MVTQSTQQLVEKLHQEGMQKSVGTLSQFLISALEQRFPDFPDNLKASIRQVTDIKRLGELTLFAGTAHSPEEFARQMAV